MGLGLGFQVFWAAISGSEQINIRLHRALHGIKDPPEIREVIREVAVPMKEAPPPREIIREVPVEVIKVVIKEVPVEVIKEVIKEVPVEVIREVEVIKEIIKEVPIEVIREVIKEVPVEVIREVVKEVAVEIPRDIPKEIIKEVPIEVIREVIREVPVEVIREVIREVPVEVIKEVIKEVPVEKIREVPKEIYKETIREVPVEVIREIIRNVPDAHGPTQVLALLQQDGRLVDFLYEDIDSYDDDQIGAAVREIHSKCRKALARYMNIEPIRTEKEGDVVSLGAGFDASAIRVTGKVSDKIPMFGTLRHKGWKAAKVELPTRASGADPTIIMPAEVEVE